MRQSKQDFQELREAEMQEKFGNPSLTEAPPKQTGLTKPNDLITSFNHTADTEGNFKGLTKREHFALEFAKAHLAGLTMTSGENHHGWTYEAIAREGLYLADALILVLNE